MTTALAELADVLAELGGVLDHTEPIAAGFAALVERRRAAGRAPVGEDLAELRDRITDVLREHDGLVVGAGLVVRPGLLAGASRWLEWWWTRPLGVAERLRVNLDEAAADFFDYTSADWYAVPAATGARHAAGPYVDHLCTNQYSVTLTSPVSAGTEFLGVVGADVPVARLEAMVLPALARLAPDAALLTADGRVVASASARLLPGHRVDPTSTTVRPALPARRRRLGGLGGWLVTQG